jgi:hypothetical protein
VAKHLGLSGEDHLAIHGIPRNRREAKRILKAFEEDVENELPIEELPVAEDSGTDTGDEQTDGTQFSLDSF